MMKAVAVYLLVLIISCSQMALAQPGNGHSNGHGNSNCGSPPCGGPRQPVPIEIEGLLFLGLIAGIYLSQEGK